VKTQLCFHWPNRDKWNLPVINHWW